GSPGMGTPCVRWVVACHCPAHPGSPPALADLALPGSARPAGTGPGLSLAGGRLEPDRPQPDLESAPSAPGLACPDDWRPGYADSKCHGPQPAASGTPGSQCFTGDLSGSGLTELGGTYTYFGKSTDCQLPGGSRLLEPGLSDSVGRSAQASSGGAEKEKARRLIPGGLLKS